MAGDGEVLFRLVRGQPDTEEVAAVTVALLLQHATAGEPSGAERAFSSWGEPEAFQAPASWTSRVSTESNGRRVE